jgi:hypothetical protein
MVVEVRSYDEIKLFKIVSLNLRGKAKEWYRCIGLALVDWVELKVAMEQKYFEVNKSILEGLIDTRASILTIVANVVKELGIMHLVTSSKSYKIALRVVIHAMGTISELSVRVGEVLCKIDFMVVDIDGYNVLQGLDFLIRIEVVVDIE